jgi:hypothetical protein
MQTKYRYLLKLANPFKFIVKKRSYNVANSPFRGGKLQNSVEKKYRSLLEITSTHFSWNCGDSSSNIPSSIGKSFSHQNTKIKDHSTH